ncbi:hypothetical protein CR513_01663, partial [Mucuna pruriens]
MISIYYVKLEGNLADLLTKPLRKKMILYPNAEWDEFQGLERSHSDSTWLYGFGSSASGRETYSYSR